MGVQFDKGDIGRADLAHLVAKGGKGVGVGQRPAGGGPIRCCPCWAGKMSPAPSRSPVWHRSRSFFTSGGSDSVETVLRLAWQYHKIRGQEGRVKFLSMKKGYTTRISGAHRLTATPISAPNMNHCCPAVSTSLPPIPIATRSMKPPRRGWRSCVYKHDRTRSPVRVPAALSRRIPALCRGSRRSAARTASC
jgi:hypothetical protein